MTSNRSSALASMKVEIGSATWGYVWHVIVRHPSNMIPRALCNPKIDISTVKEGRPDCLACRREQRRG